MEIFWWRGDKWVFQTYVCCDDFVTQAELEAIKQGLTETRLLFGSEVIFYGKDSWKLGKYKNATQLMNSMPRNSSGRVNASQTLDRMVGLANSWDEHRAMILVTGLDLCTDNCGWCFGAAKPAYKVTIQSVNRYRGLSSMMESACIRRTLRHEMGHIFCCAYSKYRSNTTDRLGIHCTNPGCSMRQTMSLNELMAAALEEDPRNCFCPQCLQDLRNFKAQYEKEERNRTRALFGSSRRIRAWHSKTPACWPEYFLSWIF